MGAQRPFSWYKHFSKFGLYPVVLTRHWNKEVEVLSDASLPDDSPVKIDKHEWGEVHYLPYKGSSRDRFLKKHGNSFSFIRRLLTLWELFSQHLSFRFNPYRFFFVYTKHLLAQGNSFCAVLISANPYPQFAVGYMLKKNLGLPWIADYRDDWTTNDRYQKVGWINKILSFVEKKSEKKWLSNAAFFISVTGHYIEKISSLISKNGELVLNGFENITHLEPPPILKSVTFMYAGTVYDKQDFFLFSDGLNLFADANPEIDVRVVFAGAAVDGICPRTVTQLTQSSNKSNIRFEILPRMNQSAFEALLFETHILFTVPYGTLKGEMPAKLFHYLSWGKPILLAGSDNDIMEKIVLPYSLGRVCRSAAEVHTAVEDFVKKYNTENVTVSEKDILYISQFLRENQSKILVEHIRKYLPLCVE